MTELDHLKHLHFVDDALIFGITKVEEWYEIKGILHVSCATTRIKIGSDRSVLMTKALEDEVKNILSDFLPLKMEYLSTGFKYLG